MSELLTIEPVSDGMMLHLAARAQDEAVAEQLQELYLAWSQLKWEADQKRLKSILKAWGAK